MHLKVGTVRSLFQKLFLRIVRSIYVGFEKLCGAEQVICIRPCGHEVSKSEQKSRYDLHFVLLWARVHLDDQGDELQLSEPS